MVTLEIKKDLLEKVEDLSNNKILNHAQNIMDEDKDVLLKLSKNYDKIAKQYNKTLEKLAQ